MHSTHAAARSVVALALFAAAGAAMAASTANTGLIPGQGEVRLKYASFDPAVGLPTVPRELRAPASNELFLVQFNTVPLDAMRDQIRALGGTIERYLTDRTHIVRLPAGSRVQVATMPFVRWVGPYEVAYRLSDEVRADILGNDGVERRYSIECMRDGMVQQQAVADFIVSIGGFVEGFTPDQYRMEATLTPAQVLKVAGRNEISFIDPWGGPGGTDMDLLRQQGGAVPLLSNLGFLGQGVRAEVFDSGLLNNHQQWAGQAPLIHSNATTTASHGTACYGIQFATGTGNVQATGFLPQREQGIFFYYTRCSQFTAGQPTRLAMNTEATDPNGIYRSVYQTSSVGSNRVTTYTTISQEVDDYLWKVDYLSFQSQSNASGTRDSRPQAWAKNIVSVGGMNLQETLNRADDVWASGASVGPATDLRVKPDLSHSFGSVFTTSTTSTTGYGLFSGTSSATPVTAGHSGLLHQMWHEGVWAGFGGGSSVFHSRPKSTTAKALLINGAWRYPTTQGNCVRARIGWGMADLTYLYNMRDKTFIVNETDVLLHGQSYTYQLTVTPGEAEFRATMIFSDPPGSTAAAQARINNLDLKVTAPNGTVYWGNNGMIATTNVVNGAGYTTGSNTTVPGGSPNTVDTVENVVIANPLAGVWTVEVIGAEIVQDARLETPGVTDADFALVVTGAVLAGGASCYANCDGSTAEPILNVADFTCFLNKFAAGDPYANCDQSTAPPILNVADFSCFLNKFAAGCP
jgi:serine protease AprX